MTVFVCARCGTRLSRAVREVPWTARLLDLPAHSGDEVDFPAVDVPRIDRARRRQHELADQFYNDELTPADSYYEPP
ncbi:hypothetical protein [Nocardia sp. NPDC057668]|uniref:hypothetical protein n=1 Tax=Nocardia sp. NPDC057668 TaxID=3346202 RepID=UPI00366D5328